MSGYDFRDACESGDLDKVKGLIKDVDINETDEYGYTGLHLAAEHGHLKIVEELMVCIVIIIQAMSLSAILGRRMQAGPPGVRQLLPSYPQCC